MARFPRSLLSDLTSHFHVICRGNNRGKLFLAEEDYEQFHGLMQRACALWSAEIYHYVFMTTHTHFLCCVPTIQTLSKMFHWIQLLYCQYYQRKYPAIGHLWHSRFRSIPILAESHLLRCGRYIELNPVAAGLALQAATYRWSSYQRYACGRPDNLVTLSPWVLAMGEDVGERAFAYAAYVEEGATAGSDEDALLFEQKTTPRLPEQPRIPKWCTR
ncbi:MAG: transposase [Deltaproteobacteria bacterium]|nr:transposase [Deltaproteobacteria bacterium]